MSGERCFPSAPRSRGSSWRCGTIPPSRLRDLMTTLIGELTEFVAAPSCAEEQADGAPCPAPDTSCDECRKLTTILEGLRGRLQAG